MTTSGDWLKFLSIDISAIDKSATASAIAASLTVTAVVAVASRMPTLFKRYMKYQRRKKLQARPPIKRRRSSFWEDRNGRRSLDNFWDR